MTAPLAPVVDGPIYAVPGIRIRVDNVLPDALVKVYQDGVEIGHATSSAPGAIWALTTLALVAGKRITATQTYTGSAAYVGVTTGVASPHSNFAVVVLAVPKALPVPVFQSGINQCSNSVWLGSLFQGATVTITQGGTYLGGGLAEYPDQWFALSGPEPTPGQSIEARQEYLRALSPHGSSALVAPEPTSLPAPVVATPLRDCQTSIDMSGMTPGANVTVTNGAYIDTATSPAAAYTLNLPPLAVGLLTAQQSFTRCPGVNSTTSVYHVKKRDLPVPEIGYALCPSLEQLTVTNLLPGEVLSVSAVTERSGRRTVKPLGSQGISTPSATVFLPALPADTIAVQVSVTLCGVEASSPAEVTAPISTSTGSFGPPHIVAPLYDCARSVVVAGANPGCLVTVFSGAAANVLANPVVATGSELVIPLWTALVTGEQVTVEQTGCHANGSRSKPLTVLAPPSPIPAPHIIGPVLSDAVEVSVTGVLPGAQVFLYVGGVSRCQLVALTTAVALPVGAAGLAAGGFIEVTQELCGQTSRRTDAGPGYANVQAPETQPSGGLVGNSNYAYANGGSPLTGVSVTVVITEDIDLLYDFGGDLTSNTQTGYGFQLNCQSPTTDATYWQQYVVVVTNNTLSAVINNWSPGFNSSGSLIEVNLIDTYPGTQLNTLSGYVLPAKYTFTIALDSSNTGGTNPANNVLSVTFSGKDENGVPFGPITQTLTSQADQQTGSNIQTSNLSPIYSLGLYLVGPDNGEAANLKSGAGTITITSNAMTVYPSRFNLPASVNVPIWGTVEDSNAVYSEVPTGSNTTSIQTFSVP